MKNKRENKHDRTIKKHDIDFEKNMRRQLKKNRA
jgi:hypothetical protein